MSNRYSYVDFAAILWTFFDILLLSIQIRPDNSSVTINKAFDINHISYAAVVMPDLVH